MLRRKKYQAPRIMMTPMDNVNVMGQSQMEFDDPYADEPALSKEFYFWDYNANENSDGMSDENSDLTGWEPYLWEH